MSVWTLWQSVAHRRICAPEPITNLILVAPLLFYGGAASRPALPPVTLSLSHTHSLAHALQVTVEAEMKAMQEAHHQQMRDMQMSMNASVDALSRTFADLHRELQVRAALGTQKLQTIVSEELGGRALSGGVSSSPTRVPTRPTRTVTGGPCTRQEEKEHRRLDSERLLGSLLGKVDEVQGCVEEERAVRIDRETQNLKRVGEPLGGGRRKHTRIAPP